jgi:23S rRNA pseudouridine1911/1915/1917 synthase
MPLSYLYNDGEIFAVYKPPGVHSVRLPSGGGESVADELLALHPGLSLSSKNPGDAGLVHRLDRDTSGVLLGATTRPVWEKLFEGVMNGAVEKSYVLLVEGEFSRDQTLSSFIGSPNRGAKKMKVYESAPPDWARALYGTTSYRTLSYFPNHDASLLIASASPARRHQVRLHAGHLGHPLLGDALYGSKRSLPLERGPAREFFLHAASVSFAHPNTGQRIVIESPYDVPLGDLSGI